MEDLPSDLTCCPCPGMKVELLVLRHEPHERARPAADSHRSHSHHDLSLLPVRLCRDSMRMTPRAGRPFQASGLVFMHMSSASKTRALFASSELYPECRCADLGSSNSRKQKAGGRGGVFRSMERIRPYCRILAVRERFSALVTCLSSPAARTLWKISSTSRSRISPGRLPTKQVQALEDDILRQASRRQL